MMPGHFHPLVASGVTLGFLGVIKPRDQKHQNRYLNSLLVFAIGILILAGAMTWAGLLRFPRRVSLTFENNPWLGFLLAVGGTLAFLGLVFALVQLKDGLTWKIAMENPKAPSLRARSILFGFWIFLTIVSIWYWS